MTTTKIEWSELTWNVIAGCTPVSAGCAHCYAAKLAYRLACMGQQKYAGLADKRNGNFAFNGKIAVDDKALSLPLNKKMPQIIFVNSMSDLFHPDIPQSVLLKAFEVMHQGNHHLYMILTKREDLMGPVLANIPAWPHQYPHVWLGVTVENKASLCNW